MKITICTECQFFLNLEPNSPRKDVWYNHLCKANKLPAKINPYNGLEQPYLKNDLGNEHFTDKEFKYCRDCNKGNCSNYAKLLRHQ